MTYPSKLRKPPASAPATVARGYTYVEVLLAVVIGGVLVLAMSGVVGTALSTREAVHEKTDLARQAAEAMRTMVQAVTQTRQLLLPLPDNPRTDWPEHIREQTLPASPPIGSSTLATAVLAVTLPGTVDIDGNGVPDADNDGDGALDEDPGEDMNNDGAAGIRGIDDNGDGQVDDSLYGIPAADDDEDDQANEEHLNDVDGDLDGAVDEDMSGDMSGDWVAGKIGVDDDADGSIDGGSWEDDDEDARVNEDWLDSLVFYLDGDRLVQRMPVPWDANSDSVQDGRDFVESTLVSHVSRLRFERVARTNERYQLVELTIEITPPSGGEVITIGSRVRVGGAR